MLATLGILIYNASPTEIVQFLHHCAFPLATAGGLCLTYPTKKGAAARERLHQAAPRSQRLVVQQDRRYEYTQELKGQKRDLNERMDRLSQSITSFEQSIAREERIARETGRPPDAIRHKQGRRRLQARDSRSFKRNVEISPHRGVILTATSATGKHLRGSQRGEFKQAKQKLRRRDIWNGCNQGVDHVSSPSSRHHS